MTSLAEQVAEQLEEYARSRKMGMIDADPELYERAISALRSASQRGTVVEAQERRIYKTDQLGTYYYDVERRKGERRSEPLGEWTQYSNRVARVREDRRKNDFLAGDDGMWPVVNQRLAPDRRGAPSPSDAAQESSRTQISEELRYQGEHRVDRVNVEPGLALPCATSADSNSRPNHGHGEELARTGNLSRQSAGRESELRGDHEADAAAKELRDVASRLSSDSWARKAIERAASLLSSRAQVEAQQWIAVSERYESLATRIEAATAVDLVMEGGAHALLTQADKRRCVAALRMPLPKAPEGG